MQSLFTALLTNPNSQQHTLHLQTLISSNPLCFLQSTTRFLQDPTIPLDIRSLACSHANLVLKRLTEMLDVDTPKGPILDTFKTLMLSKSIPLKIKQFLVGSAEVIITSFLTEGEVDWLIEFINQMLTDSDQNVSLAMTIVFEALARSELESDKRCRVYKETVEGVLGLGSRLLEGLNQRVDGIQGEVEREVLDGVMGIAENLRKWYEAASQITDRLVLLVGCNQVIAKELLLRLSNNQILNSCNKKVLGMRLQTSKQPPVLFSLSGLELDEKLNTIKAHSLQIQTNLVSIFSHSCEIRLVQSTLLLSQFLQLVPSLTCTLTSLPPKTLPQLTDHSNSNLLQRSMTLLSRLLPFQYLYNTFSSLTSQLLNHVITILQCTAYQLDLLDDDPSAYLQLCLDLCNNQQRDGLGNAAAGLLDALARCVDGGLTQIVVSCGEMVRRGIEVAEGEQRRKVLSALKMLCILSYLYMDRPDLHTLLHSLISSQQLLIHYQPIELCWVYLLLSYNLQTLHPYSPSTYSQLLLLSLNTPDTDPTAVFVYDLLDSFVEGLVGVGEEEVWEVLTRKVSSSRLLAFWDGFEKVLEMRVQGKKELGAKVVGELAERMKSEWVNTNNKDRSCMYKVLQIIMTIVRQKQYIKQHPDVIDPLYSIVDLLEFAKDIDFQDNLCKILGYIFLSKPTLSCRQFSYLPYLQACMNKGNNNYDCLLQLLCSYLTKGQNHLNTHPELMPFILTLINRGLSSQNQITICQACMLEQIAVRNLPSLVDNYEYFYKATEYMMGYWAERGYDVFGVGRMAVVWMWMLVETDKVDVGKMLKAARMIRAVDGYNCVVAVAAVNRLVTKNRVDQETTLELLKICINLLQGILQNQQRMQQQQHRRRPQPNLLKQLLFAQQQLQYPDKSSDPFSLFRDTLTYLQQNSPSFPQLLQKLTSTVTTMERLRTLTTCIDTNNRVRKYIKVDRKKMKVRETLEQDE